MQINLSDLAGVKTVMRADSALIDDAVEFRRRLHRRPELSGSEFETTALIRQRIQSLGLREIDCSMPTGLVALLETQRPGSRVMLRADIDAVPVTETAQVPFASEEPSRMHGCGHDAHTAILLACAELLARAEDLTGSFVFCFQPAEETLSGARQMLAAGLLEALRPDYVVGLHVLSLLPTAVVFAREHLQHAWAVGFRVTMRGGGGHAASGGLDLTERLGELCLRLPAIAEGLATDDGSAVAAIGRVTTDGAWNVAPTIAVVTGTHRAFSLRHHRLLTQRLEKLADELGGTLSIETTCPAVMNHSGPLNVLQETCADLGVRYERLDAPMLFADDVAEFLNRVPGCYFLVGARPPELEAAVPHHAPEFRIDERAIGTGIDVLTSLAARLAAPAHSKEEIR